MQQVWWDEDEASTVFQSCLWVLGVRQTSFCQFPPDKNFQLRQHEKDIWLTSSWRKLGNLNVLLVYSTVRSWDRKEISGGSTLEATMGEALCTLNPRVPGEYYQSKSVIQGIHIKPLAIFRSKHKRDKLVSWVSLARGRHPSGNTNFETYSRRFISWYASGAG